MSEPKYIYAFRKLIQRLGRDLIYFRSDPEKYSKLIDKTETAHKVCGDMLDHHLNALAQEGIAIKQVHEALYQRNEENEKLRLMLAFLNVQPGDVVDMSDCATEWLRHAVRQGRRLKFDCEKNGCPVLEVEVSALLEDSGLKQGR